MQITLNQSEILLAIDAFVREQISVKPNQSIQIDLRATRGEQGFSAVLDIVGSVSNHKPSGFRDITQPVLIIEDAPTPMLTPAPVAVKTIGSLLGPNQHQGRSLAPKTPEAAEAPEAVPDEPVAKPTPEPVAVMEPVKDKAPPKNTRAAKNSIFAPKTSWTEKAAEDAIDESIAPLKPSSIFPGPAGDLTTDSHIAARVAEDQAQIDEAEAVSHEDQAEDAAQIQEAEPVAEPAPTGKPPSIFGFKKTFAE